jgi:hypothetical protein
MINFKANPERMQGSVKCTQIHPSIAKSETTNIVSEIEWDGTYVQKRFHRGRTDQNLGHNDRMNDLICPVVAGEQ